ncbi:transposase [Plakobranchus ocellatus]|uniref:Transposase n=1 Tax=Plakobranchus ocellatus TaxID=259542 RepID=A0AAV4A2R5_9GAST|nr:transposase [Plakobranchus ocellatus]
MFMRQWRLPMTFSSNSALLSSFWQLRDVLLQTFINDEMCISDCAVRKWNVKPNRWSIDPKLLQVQGSSRLLPVQERSCSPFSGTWREFLEQGQTVNSERYISTLRALKLRLRRVRRDKDSILQYCNAHPHTSRQTQDALRQIELTTLPHLAYSPSDYYLSSPTQEVTEGPSL